MIKNKEPYPKATRFFVLESELQCLRLGRGFLNV